MVYSNLKFVLLLELNTPVGGEGDVGEDVAGVVRRILPEYLKITSDQEFTSICLYSG